MSVIGDAPIVSWRWDFGDGNTSFQQNPTNVYTNPGTYTVYLEVTDANGCTHRYTRNNLITILSNRTVDFSAAPSFGCTFPATINFTDLTLGGMLTAGCGILAMETLPHNKIHRILIICPALIQLN